MPEQFIHPNWHVVVLHFPLGLLGAGVALEWLSYLWPKSGIRTGGRWMILMGAMLAIPTVTLGLYAYRDVVAPQASVEASWKELVQQSHWSEIQWRYMNRHLWLEVAGTGLAVLAVVIWLAASDRARAKLHGLGLILLTVALGLMVVGGWYSGESVYRYGTAVAVATPQARQTGEQPLQPVTPPAAEPTAPDEPATAPAEAEATAAPAESTEEVGRDHDEDEAHHPEWVMRYIPPIQLHMLMAGATLGFAMAAIGLSIRRWSQQVGPLPASAIPAGAAVRAGQPILHEGDASTPGQPIAPAPPVVTPPTLLLPIFPARFWLAAFLFGLLTAGGGIWMTGDWKLEGLLEPLQGEGADWKSNRIFWHVVFGLTIVLSTLLLAITTRVSRRAKFFTLLFILLLVLAVAGQVWVGVLLLYDSPAGPVTCFSS